MVTAKRPTRGRRNRPSSDRWQFAASVSIFCSTRRNALSLAAFFFGSTPREFCLFARRFCSKRSLTGTDPAPILTLAARLCAASSMRNQLRRNRRPGHARDERAVRSDRRGIWHRDRRSVGRHTMDSSSPWLPATPWLALVRSSRHADLPPMAPVRVVVLLRRLRAARVRHRRRHRGRQRPAGGGGRHRHVDLALAAVAPGHDLRLGPLGERG